MLIIIHSVFKNKMKSAHFILHDLWHFQEKLEFKVFWMYNKLSPYSLLE